MSSNAPCDARKRHTEEEALTEKLTKVHKPNAEPSSNGSEQYITIKCDDNVYQIKKNLLSQNSVYFQQLLEGPTQMKESQTNEIELKGVQADALNFAIQFIHGEEIKISWENIEELLDVSSHLLIEGLIDECSSFLLESFNPLTYQDVVDLSKQFSLVELYKQLKQAIADRFHEFTIPSALHKLEAEFIQHAVYQDSLDVTSELALFNIVMEWLANQEKVADDIKEKLLTSVRYCLMSADELENIHKNHQLPSSVTSLVSTALQYHQDLDFKYSIPIRVDIQNKMRHTKPTLILVSEGSWSQNYEILACEQSFSGSHDKPQETLPHTLYRGVPHHRTCGAVSIDNCLYVLSLHSVGGFDHNASVELYRFDPRTSKQHILEFPPVQIITTGEHSLARMSV